jgi:ketosteroid isomerase-like protein
MLTKTDTIVEQEIHEALMKWIEAVEGRELDMLPEVVAQDPSLVWIGSDVTDWVTGYGQLEQVMQAQNNALQDIHITVSEETIHTYPQADYAWATNRWIFRACAGTQVIELPLRCTWILDKRVQGWRIVHFHKSVGVSG